MLQYLVILLDDTSVSYCHYAVPASEQRIMSLETLKQGIVFAMKENLNIQFVYPDYNLPQEYQDIIETIDHTKIVPCGYGLSGEVVVIVADSIDALRNRTFEDNTATCVVRTSKAELFAGYEIIGMALHTFARLNVVITDVDSFTDEDFIRYKDVLDKLSSMVEQLYVEGKSPQINILTDRMMLTEMNNCGAGDTTVTLAPDGRFYVCPAFYHARSCNSDEARCVGDLPNGLEIKNKQLYRLDHAPLCRRCDAYQCRRCIWLNRRTTLEVNTPGHEQCVVAHLERNASRSLLAAIRRHGTFMPEKGDIKRIEYLDPFEVREQW